MERQKVLAEISSIVFVGSIGKKEEEKKERQKREKKEMLFTIGGAVGRRRSTMETAGHSC